MNMKRLAVICMLGLLGLSASACNNHAKDAVSQEQKNEFTQFEGSWYSTNFEYDKIVFDEAGNWKLYSSEAIVSQGCMEYIEKEDCYYIYQDQDSNKYVCSIQEDNHLEIDSIGNFARLTGNNTEDRLFTTMDFNLYYDFWYKDGNLGDTSLLLDSTGLWELDDTTGVVASGTIEIDTETNNAMILKDESGEKVALVTVDDSDAMIVTVYNEELMKLQDSSIFYRKTESM